MRVLVLGLIVCAVLCQCQTDLKLEFNAWKQKYSKVYATQEEEDRRYHNFVESYNFVQEHNSNPNNKWEAEMNEYSDHTHEEFAKLKLSSTPQECSATGSLQIDKSQKLKQKRSMDWRDKKIISPVKSQGHCGSCWTFSTTGCLEAHWALANNLQYGETGTAPLIAEQQLVDCAGNFNNNGCHGGLPSQAFEYIHYAGGIKLESQYSYTAKDGNCTIKENDNFAVSIKGHSVNITDEDTLLYAVSEIGPVSIAYQVKNTFRFYKKGVYHDEFCATRPDQVNHAVLAVGFGTDEQTGIDYWLIKNSWGEGWGDNGYFKMERGVNMCAVAVCNAFPDVTGKYTSAPEIQMERSDKQAQVYL